MAQTESGNLSKLTPIKEARLELFLLVKESLQADDPAPWRKVNQQEIDWSDADGYTLGVKQNALAMSLMQRALLLGDLTASFYEDGQEHDLPAWIWEEASGIDASMLSINPLLPDQWWRLSGRKIYLGKDALRKWLKSINWKAIERSQDMPAAHDVAEKPSLITERDLPSGVYASLTEALSWLAFGISLEHGRFVFASTDYDPEKELMGPKWQDKLKDALAQLVEKGLSGKVGFVGKYVDHIIDHDQVAKSVSAIIEPLKFNDYAKYDSHTGGLLFGSGLAWVQEGEHSQMMPSARDDGFREVKVKREDLEREFPKKTPPEAQIQSTGQAENECKAWLIESFKNDPQSKTKAAFKDAALERFNGRLTGRGFERCWAATAPKAGRSNPGRKGKKESSQPACVAQ